MQTFLPYPSFADSAAVLDTPRLGKQRVETLQILRALVVPTYGWRNHPAVAMWRGFVPGLTAYGLATVDAWTARGHADATRAQLLEFAPWVEGVPQQELAGGGSLPPWLGDPALHESHRSKLLAKDPAFYGSIFPGTPSGLDYVWPEAAPEDGWSEPDLWVLRVPAVRPSADAEMLGIPLSGPKGTVGPAWRQQLEQFGGLRPGDRVAVLREDAPTSLPLAEVTGPVASAVIDGQDHLAVAAALVGTIPRSGFPVPAELQNPRRLFLVHGASAADFWT